MAYMYEAWQRSLRMPGTNPPSMSMYEVVLTPSCHCFCQHDDRWTAGRVEREKNKTKKNQKKYTATVAAALVFLD